MLKIYKNKEWLQQRYVVEKKHLKELAKESAVNRQTIRNWIDYFQLQNGSEYKHRKCIYKELNDKIWLYQKYFAENLSTLQISHLVGANNPNSVRQALQRFGWTTRNRRAGIVRNTEDVIIINNDFIDGSLLGDSGLGIFNKRSNICCPYLYKKNKYQDHLYWFAKHLYPEEKIELREEIHTIKYKGRVIKCKCFSFRTQSSDKLKEFYKRWYPATNKYKKVVPKDIILTPKVILNWFLDDGYSTWRHREGEICKSRDNKSYPQNTKQVILGFCSESFSKRENEFLRDKLIKLGIGASVRKSNGGTGWRIFINQTSTNDFFDLIGECPVDSLKYKWKRI